LVKIKLALAMANIVIILLTYLKVKKKSAMKNKNNGIIVNIAGYISHAAAKSPRTKKAIERCRPQPGQSMPYIFFEKHGNM
jgi:hypothetical protein